MCFFCCCSFPCFILRKFCILRQQPAGVLCWLWIEACHSSDFQYKYSWIFIHISFSSCSRLRERALGCHDHEVLFDQSVVCLPRFSLSLSLSLALFTLSLEEPTVYKWHEFRYWLATAYLDIPLATQVGWLRWKKQDEKKPPQLKELQEECPYFKSAKGCEFTR